jgi:hypothetical protein
LFFYLADPWSVEFQVVVAFAAGFAAGVLLTSGDGGACYPRI